MPQPQSIEIWLPPEDLEPIKKLVKDNWIELTPNIFHYAQIGDTIVPLFPMRKQANAWLCSRCLRVPCEDPLDCSGEGHDCVPLSFYTALEEEMVEVSFCHKCVEETNLIEYIIAQNKKEEKAIETKTD